MAEYKILLKVNLQKVREKDEMKKKYYVSNGEKEYIILYWDGIDPIIYDKVFDDEISKHNWCYHQSTGVAFTLQSDKNWLYMHDMIGKLINLDGKIGHKVRENRCDNRIVNLVGDYDTVEEKKTRNDKKPPPDELVKAGILELPRFVRWENNENRFVIEHHPQLQNDIRSKIVGKRNKKQSVLEKYDDILKELDDLDVQYYTDDEIRQQKEKKMISADYKKICQLVV